MTSRVAQDALSTLATAALFTFENISVVHSVGIAKKKKSSCSFHAWPTNPLGALNSLYLVLTPSNFFLVCTFFPGARSKYGAGFRSPLQTASDWFSSRFPPPIPFSEWFFSPTCAKFLLLIGFRHCRFSFVFSSLTKLSIHLVLTCNSIFVFVSFSSE